MLRIENIEGVIWDYDGVLQSFLPFAQSLRHYNRAAVAAFNTVAEYQEIDHGLYHCVAMGMAQASFEDHGLSTAQFTADFRLDPVHMHHEFHREMRLEKLVAPYPQLPALFQKLSHLKHAILTQGERGYIHRCNVRNGLTPFFNDSVIVPSEDFILEDGTIAKKSKNRLPIEMALAAIGLPPEKVAFAEDMAKNLKIAHDDFGIQTVYVEENGLEPEWLNPPETGDTHITHTVRKAADFLRLLAAMPA